MKILAFTDLHSSKTALRILRKKSRKADVLACAGDFTYFEQGMRKVLEALDSFGKTIVLVNGNHESPEKTRKECQRLKNTKYIHKAILTIGEYAFIGHGGEGFALRSREFEQFHRKTGEKLRKLRKEGKKIIFITHQPPHNTKLDYIWAHHGNKSYRKFIDKEKPILAICGHLHETQGKHDITGRTVIINPGPRGVMVEV